MPGDLNLLARLLAYRDGRAQRCASHLQVSIQRDAWVLCPIAMAGEDTTIHIVVYGRLGAPPRIRCVPDPRKRDDQYALFEALGTDLERYFEACRTSGRFPQLWVPSVAVAGRIIRRGPALNRQVAIWSRTRSSGRFQLTVQPPYDWRDEQDES